MPRPKVLITVPTTGWIHKQAVFALMRLQQDSRFKKRIILPTHSPFENNLHHIVREWMDDYDEDFWLTFDNDNPPTSNPLDLVALDKDIIGCPTPVWHCTNPDDPNERPMCWNAYQKKGDGFTEWPHKKGLQKVDAVGTGCVLFARRVFENPEMRKAPFQRTTLPDGRVEYGNDLSFCQRATKQGFEVWAHYGYPCGHINEVDLMEVARVLAARERV